MSRLFTSSKFLAAFVNLIAVAGALYLGIPEEKLIPVLTALSAPLTAYILGTSYEDAKAKEGLQPSTFTTDDSDSSA